MSSVVESIASSLAPSPSAPASAPLVVDVEALLQPIAGDNPAGESLQYSGLYDEIREARRVEENLAQGDWQRETKVADYETVIELATDALTTQTKDLQICAWLTEALTKVHGFAGLRDSLNVMRGLHEAFWETLYPELEDDDLEARANAVAWMDRQAALVLKEVPLTKSSERIDYNYIQFEQSQAFNLSPNLDSDELEKLRARAAEENKITSEDWIKAKNATRRSAYETMFATLNECWDAYQSLDRVMDEKFGRETPGLGALKKSLDTIRTTVERIVKEKRQLEPDASDAAAAANGHAENGAAPTASTDGAFAASAGGVVLSQAVGPVRSRQDAINRLAEAAAFFRQTEPHSPVSYLVERAIKWSRMPLSAWLEAVIKDSTVLDHLRETLDMKNEDES